MVDRLESPPRMSGEPASDVLVLRDYVWQMWQNLILEKGVPQTVDQPAGTVDPDTGVIGTFPVGFMLFTSIATDPATYLGYGTWERRAQGRAIVGVDEADPDFATAGLELGEKQHTLTEAEMPAHTHVQDAHNHTQDAHTHTQNAHNHVQDAHNHTQDAHDHGQNVVNSANDGTTGVRGSSDANTTQDGDTESVAATNQATTATNQAATATNQNTTATNQAATATNQDTGGGLPHNNLQPSFTCYIFERTA